MKITDAQRARVHELHTTYLELIFAAEAVSVARTSSNIQRLMEAAMRFTEVYPALPRGPRSKRVGEAVTALRALKKG